ncbi:hypothetical protein CSOJ01_13784 [Colletotrichum sojae]|uniref:Uncharacterized protein n=1 Tax=Colletotrichum sojae TaxID=2175907 RepID=A0A8H6ISG4_9PEZI|nr:hypothetical protein CSOJ01_13784 [Colletotrichum sojae]
MRKVIDVIRRVDILTKLFSRIEIAHVTPEHQDPSPEPREPEPSPGCRFTEATEIAETERCPTARGRQASPDRRLGIRADGNDR